MSEHGNEWKPGKVPSPAARREPLLETRKFRVVRVTRPWPDGQIQQREIVEHPGAVTIIPLVDATHVCLIKNFRVTAGQSLLELPAGTLEFGEDPAETARRELAEETGYRADEIRRLCQFYVSPGILDEIMYLFVASRLTPGATALEQGEHIEPFVVSWSAAVRMAMEGKIQDAKSLVGLLYYDRLRQACQVW